jgi:hypothetical protein
MNRFFSLSNSAPETIKDQPSFPPVFDKGNVQFDDFSRSLYMDDSACPILDVRVFEGVGGYGDGRGV